MNTSSLAKTGPLAMILLLCCTTHLPGQGAPMRLDISPATVENGVPVALGSTLFFVATEPGTGTELWQTDGTLAGTQIVKDINPGAASSSPQFLTPFGGSLFFRADEPGTGSELWKTDGTSAGTVVIDVEPGAASSYPRNLIVVDDTLFLDGGAGSSASLWTSDGTTAGTQRVGFRIDGLGHRAAVGDTLFFDQEAEFGNELWQSDGTLAGTRPVSDDRSAEGPQVQSPQGLWTTDSLVYFTGYDLLGGNPDGLWRSNGSSNGTFRLFTGNIIFEATVLNDTLYFLRPGFPTAALWKTDGTVAGTVHVTDLPNNSPRFLSAAGSRLYFDGYFSAQSDELWTSDGTATGTVLVRAFPGLPGVISRFTHVGNSSVIFSASDGTHGYEPWFSDGTAAGTTMVQDIAPGAASSSPGGFTVAGSNVFFTADDGAHGRELWVLPNAVTDPTLLVESLTADVLALNLQNGIANSLDAKLDSAVHALLDVNQANDGSALNSLSAFVNAVEAQRGNKIPDADADVLIARAQAIMAQLAQ